MHSPLWLGGPLGGRIVSIEDPGDEGRIRWQQGKSLKEQVTLIFADRLEHVVRDQKGLAHERTLLERATGIKHDD